MAISPQQSKYSAQIARRHKLSFPVLGDPGNAFAAKLGLVFTLPADLKEVYDNFGIDLERFNGDASWTLPMPARFVVDSDATVRSSNVNPDYTSRPEPGELLEILRGPGKR